MLNDGKEYIPCEIHLNKLAKKYCEAEECKKFYCNACILSHHTAHLDKVKNLNTVYVKNTDMLKKILSLSENTKIFSPDITFKCMYFVFHQAKFYCNECHDFICKNCTKTHDKEHHITSLGDFMNDFKELINFLISIMDFDVNNINQNFKIVPVNFDETNSKLDLILANVSEIKYNIKNKIIERNKVVLNYIEKMHKFYIQKQNIFAKDKDSYKKLMKLHDDIRFEKDNTKLIKYYLELKGLIESMFISESEKSEILNTMDKMKELKVKINELNKSFSEKIISKVEDIIKSLNLFDSINQIIKDEDNIFKENICEILKIDEQKYQELVTKNFDKESSYDNYEGKRQMNIDLSYQKKTEQIKEENIPEINKEEELDKKTNQKEFEANEAQNQLAKKTIIEDGTEVPPNAVVIREIIKEKIVNVESKKLQFAQNETMYSSGISIEFLGIPHTEDEKTVNTEHIRIKEEPKIESQNSMTFEKTSHHEAEKLITTEQILTFDKKDKEKPVIQSQNSMTFEKKEKEKLSIQSQNNLVFENIKQIEETTEPKNDSNYCTKKDESKMVIPLDNSVLLKRSNEIKGNRIVKPEQIYNKEPKEDNQEEKKEEEKKEEQQEEEYGEQQEKIQEDDEYPTIDSIKPKLEILKQKIGVGTSDVKKKELLKILTWPERNLIEIFALGQNCKSVFVYNPFMNNVEDIETESVMKFPMCHSFINVQPYVYLTGGKSADNLDEELNIFISLRRTGEKTFEVNNFPDMLESRSSHCLAYVPLYNYLVAISGSKIKSCELFDFETNEWGTLPDLSYSRERACCAVINEAFLYVLLGYDKNENKLVTSIEILDLSKMDEWQLVNISGNPNLLKKQAMSYINLQDGENILITGGFNASRNESKDVGKINIKSKKANEFESNLSSSCSFTHSSYVKLFDGFYYNIGDNCELVRFDETEGKFDVFFGSQ